MLVIRIGGWMYWDLFLYLIVLLNISKNGIKQGNHIGQNNQKEILIDFYLKANEIAVLYKNRWQVELFFKWIKQYLKVKTFWGTSENAVKIQIHIAIITYCLINIIKNDLKLKGTIIDTMRIIGNSSFVSTSIMELFTPCKRQEIIKNIQLEFNF